jgi:hypothetical protein
MPTKIDAKPENRANALDIPPPGSAIVRSACFPVQDPMPRRSDAV